MEKKTIEEAAERLIPIVIKSTPFGSKYEVIPKKERSAFLKGAEWYAKNQSEQSEWVSVEDRLPEGITSFKTMSDWVQVYGTLVNSSYLGTGRYCHDRNKWYATCINGNKLGDYITHWQPLPLPPKQ